MTRVLDDLLDFFTPLASHLQQEGGVMSLVTPETNVLALNASYLRPASAPDLARIRAVHEEHGLPPLIVSDGVFAVGRPVDTLRAGDYQPREVAPDDVVVEQVSRLQLTTWAGVLARGHGTPEWAKALTSHLALKLEGRRDYVLLLSYRDGMPVGALLWRGGAAHLWGVTDKEATFPLLDAAYNLAGTLRLSAAPGQAVPILNASELVFSLLDGG